MSHKMKLGRNRPLDLAFAAGTIVFVFILIVSFLPHKRALPGLVSQKSSSAHCSGSNGRYNFMFIETKADREFFDLKQLCAIESAAFTNPLADVYVFSLNAKFNQTDFLERYPNVRLVPYNLGTLFGSSFFASWWKANKDMIIDSMFSVEELSDLVRLYLLWLNGGIYSDLDTITIRSFQPLLNFTGMAFINEAPGSGKNWATANGVMVFPERHRILFEAINDFRETYQPGVWAANGPQLLQRTITSYCNIADFFDPSNSDDIYTMNPDISNKTECNLALFPSNYFYPYSWKDIYEAFKPNNLLPVKLFMDAYSIHFYSHATSSYPYKRNTNSIHEFFSKLYCPFTYNLVEVGMNTTE